MSVVALVTAFFAGALLWAGAFPYQRGPVPRGRLVFCGGCFVVIAVVATVLA